MNELNDLIGLVGDDALRERLRAAADNLPLGLCWPQKAAQQARCNRALVTVPVLDRGRSNAAGDPATPNMLIHGDNLIALRALLPDYQGAVRCVYIDPPYNARAGNRFGGTTSV